MGFWAAMAEEFPETREQRCWVHKTANILDKLPKRMQPHAKKLIHEMYLAATRDDAENAYKRFIAEYGAKWPKAVDCSIKDHDVLFTFYDFPTDPGSSPGPPPNDEPHRIDVRDGSSPNAPDQGVRVPAGDPDHGLQARDPGPDPSPGEKHWRKLNGHHLMAKVIDGVNPGLDPGGVLENAA